MAYNAYREVVVDLIEEYKAAERADYVTWGGNVSHLNQTQGPTGGLEQDTY